MQFEGPLGRKALRRLKAEQVVWLTSVDQRGVPQPRPVWFHWDGEDVLVVSRPKAGKVKQIAAQPHVALHFNSDEAGGEIVVLHGEGAVLAEAVAEERMRAYLRKYRQGIADLEMTAASFRQAYRVPIRIRPTSLWGF